MLVKLALWILRNHSVLLNCNTRFGTIEMTKPVIVVRGSTVYYTQIKDYEGDPVHFNRSGQAYAAKEDRD